MPSVPPSVALEEFFGPTTRHTRRVEIYEADGITRWEKDTELRLKDGSVTVDYSRDERRAMDLTLRNDDGVLLNAPEEFWYDKIIKVFRGVRVDEKRRVPSILVIAEASGADLSALAFRSALTSMGFGAVQVTTVVNSLADFQGHDILVNLNVNNAATIGLLKQAYNNGFRVLSFGYGSPTYYGDLFGTPAPTTGTVPVDAGTVVAPSGTHPVARGWAAIQYTGFERTNHATDPHAKTLAWTANRGWGGGSGNGTYTFVTGAGDGPIPEITTYRRKTWSASGNTNADTGFEVRGKADGTYLACLPRQKVTASVYMRASAAKTGRASINFYDAAGTLLGSGNGETTTLPAGAWTRVSATITAPDNATQYAVLPDIVGSGSLWAAGNTLDATGLLVERGTKVTGSVLRTSYAHNPRVVVDTTGWNRFFGTGGNATSSRQVSPGYIGNTVYRVKWTTATTAVGGGINFTTLDVLSAGTQYTYSIYVKSTIAQRMNLFVQPYAADGTTVGFGMNGTDVVLTANTWTRLSVTQTLPTNSVRAQIRAYARSGTGGVVWSVNAELEAQAVLIEVGNTVGTYFDQSVAGGEWTSTAYASPATLRDTIAIAVQSFFSAYMYGAYWESTTDASPSIQGFRETSVLNSTVAASAGMTPIAATASGYGLVSVFSQSGLDKRWVMYHVGIPSQMMEDQQVRAFFKSAVNWLNPVKMIDTWEVQIGEFMIDRISEPNFPYEVKLTGRDYTKKCMLSKFAYATQFDSGMALESVIAAIAGSAGITKRNLPITNIVINRAFFYERGTSRWEAIKEIATAYNYEIFFDASGYLTMRTFNDPSTTAPSIYIKTGKDGQVGSYEKSTSDSRIFNHIMVIGESSDGSTPNVYAERINNDPLSPTRVEKIGDRYMEFSSAFITTQAQADALADSLMGINALEEFELSFESLMMPWLEAGEIIGWLDPRPAPGDPTTFLLSSITLPLGLSPMSGTAKRVTMVGG